MIFNGLLVVWNCLRSKREALNNVNPQASTITTISYSAVTSFFRLWELNSRVYLAWQNCTIIQEMLTNGDSQGKMINLRLLDALKPSAPRSSAK